MSRQPANDDSDDDGVSADERALFRDSVGPVRQLGKHAGRRAPARAPPPPRPRQTEADDKAVMQELLDAPPVAIETGDNMAWRRDGVQISVLRKLGRGQYRRCRAELDLHGMSIETARRSLTEFLRQARLHDYRCVRIVHGKGKRSGNRGPVLKARIGGWLRKSDQVMAYCSTPEHDGGTGAVYVLLRNR